MKEKPLFFTLIALFFFGVALCLPLQIAFLYDHDLFTLSDWSSLWMKVTPLNLVVIAICLINAYLSLYASKALKFTLPIGIVIIAINNFFVSLWGNDYSFSQATSATVAFSLLSYSYIFTSAYDALKNPKLQWWKIPKRYKQNLPVRIEAMNHKKVLTSTFDISKTGTFLSSMTPYTKNLMNDLHIGEHINLYISTEKGDIQVQGRVVRKEFKARGDYPQGMGIEFSHLDLMKTFQIKSLLTNMGV